MKPLKPKLYPFELTYEEFCTINELIDRDKAKVLRRYNGSYTNTEGEKVEYHSDYCPSCDTIISENKKFCSECGQRLDCSTTALE